MRAQALAQPYPIVTLDTDAMEAARAMAAARLPGLIVTGDDGRPYTVLPGSQVLRFLIPRYIQDEPGLARALDEEASDALCRRLERVTVRDVLPRRQEVDDLPVVDGDATALEIAAVMARMHSPLVAVLVRDELIGAITVSGLLDYLLPPTAARR
jgi:CBS domain-containing protein